MPAVFGGATGDDFKTDSGLNWTGILSNLVFGWFHPTTLTAGKGYWGCTSATTHAEVAPSTGEVRFVFNRSTGDASYDTTDAGITTGNWWWLCLFSRGAGSAWMLPPVAWLGTPGAPPRQLSITSAVAGSGTNGASITALGFGNTGPADTNAFEGDIGHVGWFHHDNETDPLINIFQVNGVSSAALTAAELDWLYTQFVVPIWFGDIGRFQSGKMRQNIKTSSISTCHLADFTTLDAGGAVVDLRNFSHRDSVDLPTGLGTLSGATNSTTNLKSPRTVLNPASIGSTSTHAGGRCGHRRSVWVR